MKTYIFITIAGVALLAITAGAWWFNEQLRPVSHTSSDHYVTIEEGESSANVAKTLEEEGIIRNATAFYLYTRVSDRSQDIQAGFYRLSPHQTIPDILNILTEGKVENIIVRIPSGADLKEITGILSEAGFSEAEIKRAYDHDYDVEILEHKPDSVGLEGYLYPDTYHIAANAQAEDLIKMILVNTGQKVTTELKQKWQKHGLTVHQGLTLASIVQKEMAEPQEQAQAAQVFLSRLEKGEPLEADPTFMYASRQKEVEGSVDVDSPYNTYKVKGLPPGPIATMDAGALHASANPAGTDYMYFVTGEDGVTRFSKTRKQHDQYIDKYGVSGT